jgi:DNA-binding transcriptional LysR family regulator
MRSITGLTGALDHFKTAIEQATKQFFFLAEMGMGSVGNMLDLNVAAIKSGMTTQEYTEMFVKNMEFAARAKSVDNFNGITSANNQRLAELGVFGASFIIGNYILPRFLNNLKENIHNDVSINVSVSHEAIEDLLDKKIDIALVENYIANDEIIYREWMEDEIVIFSNQKLPARAKPEDLLSYKWICRNPESNTGSIFKECLEKANYPDCDTFEVTSEVTSATTIVQTVLHSDKNATPAVSIVSRNAIESLLKSGALYESRIGNQKMLRKLYIAYRKDRKHDAFIENVVDYLLKIK